MSSCAPNFDGATGFDRRRHGICNAGLVSLLGIAALVFAIAVAYVKICGHFLSACSRCLKKFNQFRMALDGRGFRV